MRLEFCFSPPKVGLFKVYTTFPIKHRVERFSRCFKSLGQQEAPMYGNPCLKAISQSPEEEQAAVAATTGYT